MRKSAGVFCWYARIRVPPRVLFLFWMGLVRISRDGCFQAYDKANSESFGARVKTFVEFVPRLPSACPLPPLPPTLLQLWEEGKMAVVPGIGRLDHHRYLIAVRV